MHRPHPGRRLLAGLTAATSLALDGGDLPRIRWNDNHRPAGTLADGVLTLRMELVRREWRYPGDDRAGVEVLAAAKGEMFAFQRIDVIAETASAPIPRS